MLISKMQNRISQRRTTWTISDHKSTQHHCLFQTFLCMLHGGQQITTLHMILGHTIHERDHSKSLVPVLSMIGVCARYQTIKSACSLLAGYVVKASEGGETPIPSTFTTSDYTMGGMDNSDYICLAQNNYTMWHGYFSRIQPSIRHYTNHQSLHQD